MRNEQTIYLLERIEVLIKDWEAKHTECLEEQLNKTAFGIQRTIIGLNLALDIINEPSNKEEELRP